MIPAQTDNIKVENNISASATGQFTVDENSLAKIMSVLTNLYTDPEGAVVREYLTNALDAQIEAQESDPNYVWRPIEVTTPSRFNKNYIVRDFGIGMSTDEINDIYSKYGKSTKETTNTQTGMLGLGSKCALTYTGQFTITGYKNGVRTRAIISKNDENIPIFQIVDTRATDEPNGVEISVPVRDSNSFHQKTAEFLRWWKDGQVLVDGKEPEKHGFPLTTSEVLEFTVNGVQVKAPVEVYAIDHGGSNYYRSAPQSYVIMGNVPYKVSTEYISRELNECAIGFAAYVPMGSIVFPPSREELTYTNTTKSTLKTISSGLFDKMYEAAVKSVTEAATYADAWRAFYTMPAHFKTPAANRGISYKGENLNVARFEHEHDQISWDYQGRGSVTERKFVDIVNAIGVNDHGTVIVTGVDDNVKITAYFKKKLRHWMVANGVSGSHAIIVENDIDSVWLTDIPRITAADVKAIKLPKTPSDGPREEVPYDWHVYDTTAPYYNVKSDSDLVVKVGKGKTLVYVSPQDYKETYRKAGTSIQAICKQLGSDYIIVVLGKNRFDKFLRTHPKAKTLAEVLKAKMDGIVGSITDAERLVGTLDSFERSFLSKVDVNLLDDPDLITLASVVKANGTSSKTEEAASLKEFARRCEVALTVPDLAPVGTIDNPVKRYPLVADLGARRLDHLVVYINAVYDQQYKP